MYFSYGWPKSLEAISENVDEKVVHLSIHGSVLVLVTTTVIQTWTTGQHRVKIGELIREPNSILDDGANVTALWNSKLDTLAVLTESSLLHFYDIIPGDSSVQFPGHSASFQLKKIKFRNCTYIPLFGDDISVNSIVGDDENILLGLSNGLLHLMSWRGQLRGTKDLWKDIPDDLSLPIYVPEANGRMPSTPLSPGPGAFSARAPFSPRFAPSFETPRCQIHGGGVAQIDYAPQMAAMAVVLTDGQVMLCSTGDKGLRPVDDVAPLYWIGVVDGIYAAIGQRQQVLAVGTRRGTVELFDLSKGGLHLRSISLVDWGYSLEDTGPISCIKWTEDNWALAVGWKQRGLAVWSTSGCRLMCTIRQGALNPKPPQHAPSEPLAYGVASMAWGEQGYQLLAAERRGHGACHLLQFAFAKGCTHRGAVGSASLWQMMQGEDRVLLIQSDEQDELKVQHLVVPPTYISPNWPVTHVTANEDGSYLAIAGKQGIILYNLRSKKWRVFGDVAQERSIKCVGLLWLGKVIAICSFRESSQRYELSFYPRYHLDESSLLCRQPLLAKPSAMDSWKNYILVACPPFEIQVFHLHLEGELSPLKRPSIQLHIVRELSIVTARRPLLSMRFVPRSIDKNVQDDARNGNLQDDTRNGHDAVLNQPTKCMLLRTDGDLSLLDLDRGSEQSLVSGVEHFWLTQGRPREEAALIEEVPWWAYGHRGMQIWYPSSQADPSTSFSDSLQVNNLDPELDFDREVYPLGVSPAAGVIVGVSQRLSMSAGGDMPCFEPTPQAQPILPCLLRHLLQRGKVEEAVQLAALSADRPHFSHSLEWLLFTIFDTEMSSGGAKRRARVKTGLSMLDKACQLVRHFPEYQDVVVSVARKTDSRHWPDLFASAGVSTELFEECFERKQYRTATCYILVIEKLEGPTISQQNALRLLQATLQDSMYNLAGELVRFLLRSGREYSSSEIQEDHSSDRLVKSFFSFGLTSTAPKVRGDVLHTTVSNILGDHALRLLAMKECRELVHFVKGTQFDLQAFLTKNHGKTVRLEDFPGALRILQLKLCPEKAAGRADTEFLLAQMQSVGFHEWIVVLATLLHKKEVLIDLFQMDVKLWTAYRRTLKAQSNAHRYQHLLDDLEYELAPYFSENDISVYMSNNRGT